MKTRMVVISFRCSDAVSKTSDVSLMSVTGNCARPGHVASTAGADSFVAASRRSRTSTQGTGSCAPSTVRRERAGRQTGSGLRDDPRVGLATNEGPEDVAVTPHRHGVQRASPQVRLEAGAEEALGCRQPGPQRLSRAKHCRYLPVVRKDKPRRHHDVLPVWLGGDRRPGHARHETFRSDGGEPARG